MALVLALIVVSTIIAILLALIARYEPNLIENLFKKTREEEEKRRFLPTREEFERIVREGLLWNETKKQ